MTFKYRYRKQIIVSIITLIIIGLIVLYFLYFKKKEVVKKPENILIEDKSTKKKEIKEEKPKDIMVDVKGEVINSGIYTLKDGSRVIDAINLAGGITKNGDTSVLNLSKKLTDEMVIIVYSYYEVRNFERIKEVEETVRENCIVGSNGVKNDACIEKDESDDSNNSTKKVSLNKATIEELMTLTGIGEAKAKSIIEYRDKNGNFKTIEDIKNVSGIGDALFDKIKENITI